MSTGATAGTAISVGPDWLTATVKPGHKMQFMEVACRRWLAARKEEGFTAKSLSWMGYSGEGIDGLSYGTRPDGMLVRLSGDLARRHATFAYGFADNITRLDLQVTILDSAPYKNRAREAFTVAGMDGRVVSGMTRTSLINSTPQGATCYIGSRTSDRMFRVYDKAAQSDGIYAPGSWRYEIEYKADRAARVAEHLAKHEWKAEWLLDVIETAFKDYRVQVPHMILGSGWRDTSPKEETDDQRRLAWLTDTIRPAVEKVMEAFDRATVLKALGLAEDETLLALGEAPLGGSELPPAAPNSQT